MGNTAAAELRYPTKDRDEQRTYRNGQTEVDGRRSTLYLPAVHGEQCEGFETASRIFGNANRIGGHGSNFLEKWSLPLFPGRPCPCKVAWLLS